MQDWPSETTELKESFEKLPSELREAIFRLGWTAVTWGAGHCASKTWVQLSEEEKAAAAQLQLDASSWPGMTSLRNIWIFIAMLLLLAPSRSLASTLTLPRPDPGLIASTKHKLLS